MKKNNGVLILVILLIIAGLFIYFNRTRIKLPVPQPSTKTTETTKPEEKKTGVFESIKDAMAKSLNVKCEYTTGTAKTVAYIKGNSIRVDGVIGKTRTGSIMKDNKLWSWDVDKKEGVIMPLIANQNKQSSQEEIIKNLEQQKQFCSVTVVSDSMFIPPTDVKFQDLTKILEKIPSTQK